MTLPHCDNLILENGGLLTTLHNIKPFVKAGGSIATVLT